MRQWKVFSLVLSWSLRESCKLLEIQFSDFSQGTERSGEVFNWLTLPQPRSLWLMKWRICVVGRNSGKVASGIEVQLKVKPY